MRLVVAEAVARMVTTVEAFGGTVKDIAGDGVLALFGAPITHEDDVERAVRASLRIVHEVAAYGAEVAGAWSIEQFSVRVGVDTGPVVLGSIGAGSRLEYAAFGDTVNTAARLQGAADPGTVLISATTRQAVEPLFEWGASRALQLKGKSEPVQACEVTAPRAGGGRARADSTVQAPVVGRERELSLARRVVDGVLAGSGAVLFLTGDAGIGKSRLVGELRAHVERSQPDYGRAGAPRPGGAAPPAGAAVRRSRRRHLPLSRHHPLAGTGAGRGCARGRAVPRGAAVPHLRGHR
jgi:hypothetical protein